MTPDDLWDKYCHEDEQDGGQCLLFDDFLAALKEYGEAVRGEAVKVCEEIDSASYPHTRKWPSDCAAAIKKMELP